MKNIFAMPEFKVGALVLIVGSLIAVMSIKVSEDPTVGGAKTAWFMTPNANGLVKNSAIRVAGIPVGVIKDIQLQNGEAKLTLVVKSEVDLRKSAIVEIKSNGILGDKYIELNPGNPNDPPLEEMGQIANIKDSGSLDNVVSEISEIAGSFKNVAKSLQEAVENDGTNKHVLGRIIQNVEKLTADLSQITSENKDQIRDIVDQVNNITKELDDVLTNPNSGVKKSWARLDKALKNVEEITEKINRGEGTIGRLVNDESTVEGINTAINNVNDFLGGASAMTTAIDFHSEYLGEQGAWKSFMGLQLQPGPDRYYLVQIVDDPVGVVQETNTLTRDGNTGNEIANIDTTKTFKNEVKLTALFAKNFYDFTIKGGLIENTGGLGFDYHFFKRRLTFSLEAFQFSNINLRARVRYELWKGIYLTGGVSDALDKSDRQSGYIGAGLFLTNDDVKYLMTKVPF